MTAQHCLSGARNSTCGIDGQVRAMGHGDSSVFLGVIVFSAPGLTLLACPWEYALTAKLSRVLNRIQVRTYDLSDAVE